MSENNNEKYISFLTKILRKIHPRISFHYAVYTVLFLFLAFSVVGIVTATTPNPGHPWTEVGDGLITFANPGSAVTYTGPTVNATLITNSIGLSGGSTLIGGTGTTDTLTFKSTSGVGTTGADIIFKTGNNGATEVGRFLNSGKFKLAQYGSGTNTGTPTYALQVDSSGNVIEGTVGVSSIRWDQITNPAASTPLNLSMGAGSETTFTVGSTTQNGFTWQSSTLSSGSLLNLSLTSTAAASDTQKALNISLTGSNVTSTQSTFGIDVSNAHSGTGATNYGIRTSASNAPNAYGIYATANGTTNNFGVYATASGGTSNYALYTTTASASDYAAAFNVGRVIITSSNATQTGQSASLALLGNSLTSGTGLYTESSTLTSGSLVNVSINGTAAATGQKGINVLLQGANASAAVTYGGYFQNNHTGTGSTNVGIAGVSGGTLAAIGGNFTTSYNAASSITSTGATAVLNLSGNFAYSANTSAGLYGQINLDTSADYTYTLGHILSGVLARATVNGSGTTADKIASLRVSSQIYNTAAVTDSYGAYIDTPDMSGSGTATNNYGIYIDDQKPTGVTNGYGLYQTGSTSINYFAGKVGIGDTTPNSLFTVGNGDLFQINTTGQIGSQQAPVSDYLFALNGTNTNNNSRIIDIVQSNASDEGSAVISLSSTQTLGTIAANRAIDGVAVSLTPSLTANSKSATISGNKNTLTLSNTTVGTTASADAEVNAAGERISITGTPTLLDPGGGSFQNLYAYGVNAAVSITPTLTAVGTGIMQTFGGQFTNSTSSLGNSSLNSTNYGVLATTSGNLTTFGVTAHYGGYFSATGTADNNYGIYATGSGGTNNYAAQFEGDTIFTSSGTIKAKVASSNGLISAGPGGLNLSRTDTTGPGVLDASITYNSGGHVAVNQNLAVAGGVYGTTSYSLTTNNLTIGLNTLSGIITGAGSGDAFKFDTSGAQTGGNLLNVKNNATSKFSVDFNGAITSASLTSGGDQCLKATSAGVITGTGSACGSGGSSTLQQAYDTDADGSDATITLSTADDSIVVSNPTSSGTDSVFTFKINQQNTTGVVSVLDIIQASNAANGVNITANAIDTETALAITANALTTGKALDISSSATYTGTGLFSLTANSATTGTLASVAGNGLTSGKGLSVTSSAAASFTGSLVDISLSAGTGASSNTGSLLTLTNSGTANANTAMIINHYATGTNNIAFRVNDAASDTTPFVIDGAGNVGVGTATPLNKLHIDAGGGSSPVYALNLVGGDGNTTDGVGITFSGDGLTPTSTWHAAEIVVSYDDTGATSYGGALRFRTNNGSTETDTAERMTILRNGSVGIGDTTPAALFTVGSGDKFQIDSSGNTSLFSGADLRFIETGGGTDYVAFQTPASIASNVTWTLPSADSSGAQCLQSNGSGILSWTSCGGGGANTALSNLASVAINISLLPGTDDSIDLGDNTHRWRDLYLGGETLHIGTSTTDEGSIAYNTTTNVFTFNTDSTTIGTYAFNVGGTGELTLNSTALAPATNDGSALGTSTLSFSDLFLASGAVINIANNDWVATHSTGILTVGTGDLRVTTAGTNTASVVTVGGTQSLTNKKLGSLTTNGFVKTSGGDGTLSVDTSTYITGNQTITLSGDVSGSGTTAITTAIGANKVLDSMIRQSAATSIIGRASGTTGNVADITASADNQVLYRTGGALTFGTLPNTALTNSSISFATGSTGTAPNWSTSPVSLGGTATINIPLAGTGVTSGTISNAAQTIVGAKTFAGPSNTTVGFQITDGTNPYFTVNTSTGTSGTTGIAHALTAPSIASAAGSTYIGFSFTPGTYTFTGTTNTTSTGTSAPLSTLFDQPILAGTGTRSITEASNIIINGAFRVSSSSGTDTLTSSYGLNILSGSALNGTGGAVTNGYGLSVNAPTGATNNYAAIFNGGSVGIGTTAPTGTLTLGAAQPATNGSGNGTNAIPLLNTATSTGKGGDSSFSTGTVLAGNGGGLTFSAGQGGAITGTPTTGFGGSGGSIAFTSGTGGAGGGTSSNGGAGGNFTITAGGGGTGTTASGIGGYVEIKGGTAGAIGNTDGGSIFLVGGSKNASGNDGNVILGVTQAGTARGNIGIGTSTAGGTLTILSPNISGTTTSSALNLSVNSMTTGTGIYAASSTLSTGKLVDLQVSGTAAGASQTALNILTTGANGTAGITTYGIQVSNTHSTNTSTNVALFATASGGATANYSAIFSAGNVGIGQTAPTAKLHILGDAGSTDAPSVLTVLGGQGGTRSGSTAYTGGLVSITGGIGGSQSGSGTAGTGGALTFTGGLGGDASGAISGAGGVGGAINIFGGQGGVVGTTTGGTGGAVNITAGNGDPSSTSNGGNVVINAGSQGTSGIAGKIVLGSTIGNVTVGSSTATSLFNVGSSAQFQVNSSGNIVSIGGVAHSISDASGTLTIDSNSGRTKLATGDFLSTSVAGVAGAAAGDIWYDSTAGKYKINEAGTTKTICNTTDAGCGAGGSGARLDQVSNATAGATIANADNAIVWNWALTTAAKTAFTFGETTAAANGAGNQSLVDISTLATSTASPLRVTSNGTADIKFNLASTGNMLIQDNGTSVATFSNTGAITFAPTAGTAFTTNLAAGSSSQILATAAPTVDMLNISNSGFTNVTNGVSGIQLTYASALNTNGNEASAQRIDLTNTSTTASTTTNGLRIVTVSSSATQATNGLKIDGITAGSGTETAINIGTGWDTGINVASGKIALGTGSSVGGSIVFSNATNNNTTTLQSGAPSGNITWTLPTADIATTGGCVKSNGSGVLSINAACGETDYETFTSNGTFTKKSNALMVVVEAWGAGGGGGGGGSVAAGTATTGGGGGGGGAYVTRSISAGSVGATETVTLGTGGNAGTGGAATGGSGTAGAVGGNTTFGALVTAYGGGGGQGGQNSATGAGGGGGGGSGSAGNTASSATGATGGTCGTGSTGGAAGANPTWGSCGAGGGTTTAGNAHEGGGGGGGLAAGGTTGRTGGNSLKGGGGGGGGASLAATHASTAGGSGGASGVAAQAAGTSLGAVAGGAAGTNAGTVGIDGNTANGPGTGGGSGGGSGGGGGGSQATAGSNGGAGANGGAPGGGGGGGGAGTTNATIGAGGAGGTGGRGEVRVWTYRGTGADLAEIYGTRDESMDAGDVVSLDHDMYAGVKKSTGAYDREVLGVISTKPGVVIGNVEDPDAKPVMVALSGRIPVKVNMENGKIHKGDYLTSSSVPGVAMKATKAGLIIGQAMTEYTDPEAPGIVVAFIKSGPSNGAKLSDILLPEGLTTDGQDNANIESTTQVGTDSKTFQQKALAYFNAGKAVLEQSVNLSEVNADRVTAGLEMITPSLVADTVSTNTITNSDGKVIALVLSSDGHFAVKKNDSEQEAITLDALGNANFTGKITADEIDAKKITGFDAIIDRITALEDLLKAKAFDDLNSVTTNKLTVSGDGTFSGQSQFSGLSFFSNTTSFTGGVSFAGQTEFALPPLFNKDTGGYALIKKGDRRAVITFENPYIATPIVNTSMTFEKDDNMDDEAANTLFDENIRFVVVNKDQTGFTILLNKAPNRDIRFSWTAFSIKDPKIFESVVEGLTIDPNPTPPPDNNPPPSDGGEGTPPTDNTGGGGTPPADNNGGAGGNTGGNENPPPADSGSSSGGNDGSSASNNSGSTGNSTSSSPDTTSSA